MSWKLAKLLPWFYWQLSTSENVFSVIGEKNVLNLPGIPVSWIFFGIFYNIIENILNLFFTIGPAEHFFWPKHHHNNFFFFFTLQRSPVSWNIFSLSSTILQKILKLIYSNRIFGKCMRTQIQSHMERIF